MSVDPPILAGETFTMMGGGVPGDVGPQGPVGPVGPIGPKGDPGGWVVSSLLLDATNLNTLTTPGLYFRATSVNTTTALNYPADGWAGWIEVTAYGSGSSVMQRATAIYTNSGVGVTYRTTWVRTCHGGTWQSWVRTDVAGHEIATDPHTQYRQKAAGTTPAGSINAFLTPGVHFSTGTNASTANGYPASAGYPGILRVEGQGTNWTQEFTFTSGPVAGQYWIRTTANTGTAWTAWEKVGLSAMADHLAAADPHPQYALENETAIGVTANLNDIKSGGFYYANGTATAVADRNFPINASGHLLVQSLSSNIVIQTFSGSGAANSYTRHYTGAAWTAWVLSTKPIDDHIANTNDPHVAVGYAKKSVANTFTGMQKISTASSQFWLERTGAPVDARGWILYVETDGSLRMSPVNDAGTIAGTSTSFRRGGNDTGWRDISDGLNAGWSKGTVAPMCRIKRIENHVYLEARLSPIGATIGAGKSSITNILNLPTGFLPGSYVAQGSLIVNSAFAGAVSTVGSLSFLSMNIGVGLTTGTWVASDNIAFSADWETVNTWPTTLPGTAA